MSTSRLDTPNNDFLLIRTFGKQVLERGTRGCFKLLLENFKLLWMTTYLLETKMGGFVKCASGFFNKFSEKNFVSRIAFQILKTALCGFQEAVKSVKFEINESEYEYLSGLTFFCPLRIAKFRTQRARTKCLHPNITCRIRLSRLRYLLKKIKQVVLERYVFDSLENSVTAANQDVFVLSRLNKKNQSTFPQSSRASKEFVLGDLDKSKQACSWWGTFVWVAGLINLKSKLSIRGVIIFDRLFKKQWFWCKFSLYWNFSNRQFEKK